MRRSRILVASTALGMSVLVGGCGGGTEAYCEDLRSAEDQFQAIEDGDAAAFEDAVNTFSELGDSAPDEVSGDWEVLNGALDEFQGVLEDAGIEFSDLAGLAEGDLPEGVDQDALAEIGTQVDEILGADEVTEASDNIEEHASSECDVQLGGS